MENAILRKKEMAPTLNGRKIVMEGDGKSWERKRGN